MSNAFNKCCPILLCILGADMLFIIEQRLKSQNIAQDKQIKVISEISEMLYSKQSLSLMSMNQKISHIKDIEIIFKTFVNCSIMKLNDVSVGKLLDLMFMSLKFQVFSANSPTQIFNICLNYFEQVTQTLYSIESKTLLKDFKDNFIKTYSIISAYEFLIIKEDILKVLGDKNVRVSLLLNEKVQNQNGFFKIDTQGLGSPFVETPGTILKFEGFQQIEYEFQSQHNENFIQNMKKDMFDNQTYLGYNMYTGLIFEQKKKQFNYHSSQQNTNQSSKKPRLQQTKLELNQLQDIFGKNSQSQGFELNLDDKGTSKNQNSLQIDDNQINIQLESKTENIQKVKDFFKDDQHQQNDQNQDNEEQDLLELMDQNI